MSSIPNKNRKYDRNRQTCAIYSNEQRAEKSKARKLAKHLKLAPWDDKARAAFEALPALCKKGNVIPDRIKSPAALRREQGVTLASLKKAAA